MTTAWHAMLRFSPRLSTFSCVLALMLTTDGCAHSSSHTFARMASLCGESLGRSAMMVQSMLPTTYPRSLVNRTCANHTAHLSFAQIANLFLTWERIALWDVAAFIMTDTYVMTDVCRCKACIALGGPGCVLSEDNHSRKKSALRTASRMNTSDDAPFHLGSLSGKIWPISGRHSAPSSASTMQCSSTSPARMHASNPVTVGGRR